MNGQQQTAMLYDTGKGLSVRHENKWLYSSRDPAAMPEAAARAVNAQEETLYIVCSPCLCYGLAELSERIPSSSAVLCLEADDALFAMAKDRMAKRALLAVARDGFSAYKSIEKTKRLRRVVEVSLSAGKQLHQASYDRVIGAIQADIALGYRNRLSLVRMGRLWTKNLIRNLADIDWTETETMAALKRRAGRRPVLVCGAGPSLDAALPHIQKKSRGVFVLACDTAAGALAQAGIAPDAVVCLEAQIYNLADFLPMERGDTYFIIDVSAHPSSFRLGGKKIITMSRWTDSTLLERLDAAALPLMEVPPLGSVGVLALHIARLIGNPIIFSGLDFSFGQGKTHCAGSPADIRERLKESRRYKANAAWAHSFASGVFSCGRELSDPALSLYAALSAAELREAGTDGIACYDFRFGCGLELPAKRIDAAEFAALVQQHGTQASHIETMPDAKKFRKAARLFLSDELERIGSLADALRFGTSREQLCKLLGECDYAYAHFPDPERVTALEHDALNRVAVEAAYWHGRMESALSSNTEHKPSTR